MRIKFILLILIQLFLLIGMIAYREHWVATGERILLRTEPVDPRDIFRGDYVQLSYEITNLNLDALPVKEKILTNEKVYVPLIKNDDGTYSPSAVSKIRPKNGKFIQGRAKYEHQMSTWKVSIKDDTGKIQTLEPRWFGGVKNGDRVTFCTDQFNNVIHFFKENDSYKPNCREHKSVIGTVEDIQEKTARVLNVEYGIESYFIEEGTGKVIEAARNARKVTIEVSLREDGKGIITALLLDGKVVSH